MGVVERFVALALRQRLFVLLCLAALTATGVVAYRALPVEAFPDLTNNQVVVVTEAPGLTSTEVEQRVTYPIETALMGVPGAEQVRSLSKFELSIVTVVFHDSVAVYFARQLVNERLLEARGRIPDGLAPTLGPVATAFGEIYQYLVEGDEIDAMERKTLHDWDVRTRLRSVPGVSEINSWGGLTKQYHVIVDPGQLDRYGLALRQVYRGDRGEQCLVQRRIHRASLRAVHRPRRRPRRQRGRPAADRVVSSVEGAPVLVGDVATVQLAPCRARAP